MARALPQRPAPSFQASLPWLALAALVVGFHIAALSRLSLLVVVVWFGAFFAARLLGLEGRLSSPERRLYLGVAAGFPLLETGLKWMIEKDTIPYSWTYLNRVEHLAATVAALVLLLPLYRGAWRRLEPWSALFFVVGLACLVGNLNEFFEYAIRTGIGFKVAHYWDTVFDMAVNLAGGVAAYLVLRRVGGEDRRG